MVNSQSEVGKGLLQYTVMMYFRRVHHGHKKIKTMGPKSEIHPGLQSHVRKVNVKSNYCIDVQSQLRGAVPKGRKNFVMAPQYLSVKL